jgi:triacylglycerol lipase
MRKLIILFSFLSIICMFPLIASADTSCATRYPIVLSHGMGYTAGGALGIGYWYNIPSKLSGHGAQVYISNQTAMAATSDRAAQLKTYVLQVLATTGAAKVNIIGHSQGGLDARYMISNLGMSSKVASLTTVCSPNRGSPVADVILGLDQDLGGWISGLTDIVYTWLFGGGQNSAAAAQYLTVSYMTNTFNPNTPNISGIYYQSWSSNIYFPCLLDKTVFIASGALIYFYEGSNDGLVSVNSAKWGTYRGNQSGSIFGCGVSHVNMCDQFLDVTPFFDAPGFYTSMVSDLKGKGY